jgi:hypothetical protein
MTILQSIETKFGFQYPALYKQLFEQNRLDWGEVCSGWYENVYPSLKANPPFLLYGNRFEILDFKRIEEEIEAFSDPEDYRNTNPEHRFIPFGQDGSGDLYCFYYHQKFKDEVPIVYVCHDADEVRVLAKNLEDFIFRHLLDSVVDVFEETLGNEDDNFKENITNMLRTHSDLLTEKRQKIVAEIYSQAFFTYSYDVGKRFEKATGLLTYNELNEILKAEIGFEHLNEEFSYMQPTETEPKIAENRKELKKIKKDKNKGVIDLETYLQEKQKLDRLFIDVWTKKNVAEPENVTEKNKRRTGTLTLKIQPKPLPKDKIFDFLKVLNWREKKSNQADTLEYYRKESVVFGIPSMETVDEAFRDRLVELKTKFPYIELSYQDSETNIIYIL